MVSIRLKLINYLKSKINLPEAMVMINATVTPTAKTNIEITIILNPSVSPFGAQHDFLATFGSENSNLCLLGPFSFSLLRAP